MTTQVDPAHHRRRGRADRQHGVRRQRGDAAREVARAARRTAAESRDAHGPTEGSTWTSEQTKSPRSFATRSAAIAVDVDVAEVGTVISLGDGIARVHGVERAMAGEMLEFPHGVFGIALNLEEDSVGAVLLGDYKRDQGRRHGQAHRPHHLGAGRRGDARPRRQRARPADRRQGPDPDQAVLCRSSASRPASSIASRCKEPLQTGLKAIDGMVPIGRGQRELIIGDRQTGKTAVARRHDHQPEGQRTSSASTTRSARSSRRSRRSCGRSKSTTR